MAYPYTYQTPYYQPYQPPMLDQLGQLRQNQMQQPMMQPPAQPMQPQQAGSGINWCQGESGAKSYIVAAGNTVLLMDSEGSSFYLKSTDASGMPLPLRIFDYVERTAAPKTAPVGPQAPQAQYVTIEEFNALADRLTALENKPCKCAEKKAEKKAREDTESA